MSRNMATILFSFLFACTSSEKQADSGHKSTIDADGDGFPSIEDGGQDCDDSSPSINPNQTDIVGDAIDQNCDGVDGTDADLDSYASETSGGTDCDDSNHAINPGASEIFYDGINQNCDNESDYDADLDGFDSSDYEGSDCDDTSPEVYPGADDTWYDGIDSDCQGNNDYDQDGDRQTSDAFGGTDCDDLDPVVFFGQSDFFDTPRSNGSYDYNCDGSDTLEIDNTAMCSCPATILILSGWVGSLPECGDSHLFASNDYHCIDMRDSIDYCNPVGGEGISRPDQPLWETPYATPSCH